MSIFNLARRPSAWLRVALVGLLLAFALDSIAHVVHPHDDSVQTLGAHGPACGYCAAFDGLVDDPKQSYAPVTATTVSGVVPPLATPSVAFRHTPTAQPRGPPR